MATNDMTAQIRIMAGLQFEAGANRYVDAAKQIAYRVYTTKAAFEYELLSLSRVGNVTRPSVFINVLGWAVLNAVEYNIFAAANNAPAVAAVGTTYLIAVTPTAIQPPSLDSEESVRQNLFQMLFGLFALNATYGYGSDRQFATAGTRTLHYAIKTKNPTAAEYDVFTIDNAAEIVTLNPDNDHRRAVNSAANMRSFIALGSTSPELDSLLLEMSQPGMQFGYDRDYGINNALFHPFFAKYYVGKRTTIPSDAVVFDGGHLPDWEVTSDTAYVNRQTGIADAMDNDVRNAVRRASMVTKSAAELFVALKPTISDLIALYNSMISDDKPGVWDNARAKIQTAFQQLETQYGTDAAIPNVDIAIFDYTHLDGKLIELEKVDTEKRFRYYALRTYYSVGVKNAVAVLLELIARVSITDLARPSIDNAVLVTLANATTTPVTNANIQPLIAYMSIVITTLDADVNAAIAKFDQRNDEVKNDIGIELDRTDVNALRAALASYDKDAVNKALYNWGTNIDSAAEGAYDIYRANELGVLATAYANAIIPLMAVGVTPAINQADFDALIDTCKHDDIETSKAALLASSTYIAVVDALSKVTSQPVVAPAPAPAPTPTPTPAPAPAPAPATAPATLAQFDFPSAAVKKTIDALKGREPNAAEIEAIKKAGVRTPYSMRFAAPKDSDYIAFMRGYGKILIKHASKVAADENATPIELACAEASIFASSVNSPSTAERKALAFSQIIL